MGLRSFVSSPIALALGVVFAAPQLPSSAQAGIVVHGAEFQPPSPGAWDAFGCSVSISGDTAVVGASGEDSGAQGIGGNPLDNSAPESGAAFVFVKSGGTWTLQAYLKASNAEAGDRFGTSVSLSGDTLVVGAQGEASAATGPGGSQTSNNAPSAGAAYVFVRSGNTWTQEAYLKASNTGAGDHFGAAVSLGGDRLVVGAWGEDSPAVGIGGSGAANTAPDSGAAYIFRRTAGAWVEEAFAKASNTESGDRFGASVCVSGDAVVVGADAEDSAATGIGGDQGSNGEVDSGAAYLFRESAAGWAQEAFFKASNTRTIAAFGGAVALDGDSLAIGARDEGSHSAGINGQQNYSNSYGAGAVYVFVRSAGTWAQQAYMKASNPLVSDGLLTTEGAKFGTSVALDGDHLAVGANFEDSCSTGINGNQTSAGCVTGASYFFQRTGATWSQTSFVKSTSNGGAGFGSSIAISGETVLVGAEFGGASQLYDLNANCGISRYGEYRYLGQDADLYSQSSPVAGTNFVFDFDPGHSATTEDALAFMIISAAPSEFMALGGTVYLDLGQSYLSGGSIPIPLGPSASTLTVPIPLGAAGLTVYAQGLAMDLGQFIPFTFSNGLRIKVCP